MSDLHTATIIDDVDLLDNVELPARKNATAGLLRITLGKIKTYLATRLVSTGGVAGQVLTKLSGTPGDYDWAAGGGGLTTEQIQDMIATFLSAGLNITLVYDDAGNALSIAAAGGGGGGGETAIGEPNGQLGGTAAGTQGFYLARRVFCHADVAINKVAFLTNGVSATCKYQPFIYNCSSANVAGTLVQKGPQVTGVTAGYNEAPLDAAANLVKGNFYIIGCCVITADIPNIYLFSAGFSGIFVGNGGSSVPAASMPAFSTGGTLYGFWGVV